MMSQNYKLYLKVEDLQGKECAVKISKVYWDMFFNPKQQKQERLLVLCFEGKIKQLVISNMKANDLVDAMGGEDDESKYVGKSIMLIPRMSYIGRKTIVISARPTASADKLFNQPVAIASPASAEMRQQAGAVQKNKLVEVS